MVHTEEWIEIAKTRQQDLQAEAEHMRMVIQMNAQQGADEKTIIMRFRKTLAAAGRTVRGQQHLAHAA